MRSVVQKKSFGSVKVFWLDKKAVLATLKERASRLVQERNDVITVVLFGSLVQDRAVPGSDADVLIILKHSDQRFIDRPLRFYKYFEDVGLSVDVFCYTEEEAKQIPLAQNALANGMHFL